MTCSWYDSTLTEKKRARSRRHNFETSRLMLPSFIADGASVQSARLYSAVRRIPWWQHWVSSVPNWAVSVLPWNFTITYCCNHDWMSLFASAGFRRLKRINTTQNRSSICEVESTLIQRSGEITEWHVCRATQMTTKRTSFSRRGGEGEYYSRSWKYQQTFRRFRIQARSL